MNAGPPDKPRIIYRPADMSALPEELKSRQAWLVWRQEERDGKWTKVPYSAVNGRAASSTNPETWATFAQALGAYRRGGYDGIGFVLSAGGGFVGVDLDHCRNPESGDIEPWAVAAIRDVDSYSEASPSGTGIRIFCHGTLPPKDRKNGQVEMYDTARFLTVTGRHIDGTPLLLEERTAELGELHAQYVARPEVAHSNGHSRPAGVSHLTDSEVLQRARAATNGAKFGRLWSGDAGDYAGDESKADMALAGMLAFWCAGDRAQIDRLFRQSGLYRPKWESRRGAGTYGELTIDRVLEGKSDFFDPAQFFTDTASKNGKHEPRTTETAPGLESVAPPAGDDAKSDLLTAGKHWIELYGADWGYDAALVLWYRWQNTHWQQLGSKHPMLDDQASTVLRELGMPVSSIGRLDGVIRMTAPGVMRSFNAAPGLVNFQNGTLEIRSGSKILREHCRADGLIYCLPYDYAPSSYPIIEEFIETTIPDSAARDAYMIHLGLALLGDTRLHYMVVIIGPTRSGKSTLLKLANLVCGQTADGFAGAELFDRQSEGLRSRATWSKKRIVAIDELPVEALRNEELVKAMSAHSGVTMRRLHQHEETANQWRPKLIMDTNEAPRYSDRSGALTGRIVPIRAPWSLPENKRNKYLDASFPAELPGFGAACIDAALKVLANPYATYAFSPEMHADLADIEREGDALKSFVAENCILRDDAWETSASLYERYRTFCAENGNTPLSQNKLASNLNARYGIETTRRFYDKKQVRGLSGITIRPSED